MKSRRDFLARAGADNRKRVSALLATLTALFLPRHPEEEKNPCGTGKAARGSYRIISLFPTPNVSAKFRFQNLGVITVFHGPIFGGKGFRNMQRENKIALVILFKFLTVMHALVFHKISGNPFDADSDAMQLQTDISHKDIFIFFREVPVILRGFAQAYAGGRNVPDAREPKNLPSPGLFILRSGVQI